MYWNSDTSYSICYTMKQFISRISYITPSTMSTMMVTTDTFVPTYPWGFFWFRTEIQHI